MRAGERGARSRLRLGARGGPSADGLDKSTSWRSSDEDPHVWMDPTLIACALPGLAEALATPTPITATAICAARASTRRAARARHELRKTLAGIPRRERKLVTSHDSLGHFADHYDFDFVGAPFGLTPESQASADKVSDLIDDVSARTCPQFSPSTPTTPRSARIASEAGVEVVDDLLIESFGEQVDTYESSCATTPAASRGRWADERDPHRPRADRPLRRRHCPRRRRRRGAARGPASPCSARTARARARSSPRPTGCSSPTQADIRWPRDRIAYLPQQVTVDPIFPATVEDTVRMGRWGDLGMRGRMRERDHELVRRGDEGAARSSTSPTAGSASSRAATPAGAARAGGCPGPGAAAARRAVHRSGQPRPRARCAT